MTAAVLVVVGDDAQSFKDIDQQVLCMGHFGVLAAHAGNLAAGSSGGFLTLETKHSFVHCSLIFSLLLL